MQSVNFRVFGLFILSIKKKQHICN